MDTEEDSTEPTIAEAESVLDTEDIEKRSRWVMPLIVAASIIAVLAAVTVWADRQFLDTEGWVETTDEMLVNDDVRGALSTFIVDELYRSAVVDDQLEQRLPEDLQGLAGVLAAALRDPAIDTVDSLLRTDAVRKIWAEANRTAHSTMVAVLEDDVATGVSTADGVVTLELGEVVRALGIELAFADELLEQLPEDTGRITVLESESLGNAQALVRIVKVLSVLLGLIVIALYALAVYKAGAHRRTAIRGVGFGLAIAGVVVLLMQRIALDIAVGALAEASNTRAAVDAILDIGTSMLVDVGAVFLILGLLVALYAMLVGPSSFATSIRRVSAPLFNREPVVVWVGVALVLLIVLAIWPPQRINTWLGGVLVLALIILAVEAFRRRERREFPDASFGDWHDWWASKRNRRSADQDATQGVDNLAKLHQLREDGGLTDAEYTAAKESILGGAASP